MSDLIHDPLDDWFRRIGTGLSDQDYEDGIRLIADLRAKASLYERHIEIGTDQLTEANAKVEVLEREREEFINAADRYPDWVVSEATEALRARTEAAEAEIERLRARLGDDEQVQDKPSCPECHRVNGLHNFGCQVQDKPEAGEG